jgi:hypothetical protein
MRFSKRTLFFLVRPVMKTGIFVFVFVFDRNKSIFGSGDFRHKSFRIRVKALCYERKFVFMKKKSVKTRHISLSIKAISFRCCFFFGNFWRNFSFITFFISTKLPNAVNYFQLNSFYNSLTQVGNTFRVFFLFLFLLSTNSTNNSISVTILNAYQFVHSFFLFKHVQWNIRQKKL